MEAAATSTNEALGRYGAPRWMRWFYTLMAVAWTGLAVADLVRGENGVQVVVRIVLAALWVVLAIAAWIVPVVGVSPSGIRRGLRHMPWSEVASVPEPSRWDRNAVVMTTAGKQVTLSGVPARLAPALRELAETS